MDQATADDYKVFAIFMTVWVTVLILFILWAFSKLQ